MRLLFYYRTHTPLAYLKLSNQESKKN